MEVRQKAVEPVGEAPADVSSGLQEGERNRFRNDAISNDIKIPYFRLTALFETNLATVWKRAEGGGHAVYGSL